jgi:sodium/potassium-transporting ATPase subunit alpha
LQIDIHYVVVIISCVSIAFGVITFVLKVIDKLGWITTVVFAIGIVGAQVPERLLATVTVSLSLPAKRQKRPFQNARSSVDTRVHHGYLR